MSEHATREAAASDRREAEREAQRVLVVRMDNLGDVLLAGPAVRAVAARADEVVLLCGPRGRAAADLLPGPDRVLEWRAPWIDPEPPPVDRADIGRLVQTLRRLRAGRALILTSFHQSPLPLALLLRMAGVPWIGGISDDYPGSLLDLRHRQDGDVPEAVRMAGLAAAAGFPAGDTRLRVREPLPDVRALTGGPTGYVVVHPGTSVPARAWPPARCAEAVRELAAAGREVVVTGHRSEKELTSYVAGRSGLDLGGRTSLAELAAVLSGAAAVVAGNTGPAHLAAAVGTPVVSLFAPTVPAARWAPHGVPVVLLGDQSAPCRDTRARECPVAGHPCLSAVRAGDVAGAVDKVIAERGVTG
jgi:ADP-heptose:LPS heptosyltransferase